VAAGQASQRHRGPGRRPSGNTAGTPTTAITIPAACRPGPRAARYPAPGTEPGAATTPWIPASVNAVPMPMTAADATSSQPTRLPGTARVMMAPTTATTAITKATASVSANTAVPGRS